MCGNATIFCTLSYIVFIALLIISTLTSDILSTLFFSPHNFCSFSTFFFFHLKAFFLAFYDLFSNDQFYLYYTDFDVILSCLCAKSLQLCLTLYNPMDCSPPGSSVHRTLQARILEWVAMPSSRGPSWPRERMSPSSAGKFSITSATWKAHLGHRCIYCMHVTESIDKHGLQVSS